MRDDGKLLGGEGGGGGRRWRAEGEFHRGRMEEGGRERISSDQEELSWVRMGVMMGWRSETEGE